MNTHSAGAAQNEILIFLSIGVLAAVLVLAAPGGTALDTQKKPQPLLTPHEISVLKSTAAAGSESGVGIRFP